MRQIDQREARFERLYRAHAGAVLAYALRRASDADAADAAAETFAVAWRRLDDVQEADALPWLYAIARRVLSTQRRSSERQGAIAARIRFEGRDEPAPGGNGDPESVLRALAALRADDREILMLAAWECLSSRDAAAVVGCSPTAYRIRLHRARLRLRRALAEPDGVPPRAPSRVRPTARENHSC